jgi:hypothetical protein
VCVRACVLILVREWGVVAAGRLVELNVVRIKRPPLFSEMTRGGATEQADDPARDR